MAETTPGAPAVRPVVMKAARARLNPKEKPMSRLTGGLLGARPKREANQVTVPSVPAKF